MHYLGEMKMLAPSMITPGKIQGMLIASGRATWIEDEETDGGYYSFVDDDSFKWEISKESLLQLKIDEQDVLDCVLQAEESLGDPDELYSRFGIGLLPNSGYLNIGATFISRNNKKIKCVFTPTSMSFPTGRVCAHDNAPVNAYFQWYYDEKMDDINDLNSFLASVDHLTGNRTANVITSPAFEVPHYEEACAFSEGYMAEDVRQYFLQRVWDYHRNVSVGHKEVFKEEIEQFWTRLKRVRTASKLYE